MSERQTSEVTNVGSHKRWSIQGNTVTKFFIPTHDVAIPLHYVSKLVIPTHDIQKLVIPSHDVLKLVIPKHDVSKLVIPTHDVSKLVIPTLEVIGPTVMIE